MTYTAYDIVIIGGGDNGFMCACYLTWAGMKVAVFEKEYELGGGACSEEQPSAAFISNPCASFTHVWNTPARQDFSLWEKGGGTCLIRMGQIVHACLMVGRAFRNIHRRNLS